MKLLAERSCFTVTENMSKKYWGLIFLMIYSDLIVFEVNASFHEGLLFQYEGPTWLIKPEIEKQLKDGKPDWKSMRIDIVYVKDPEGKQFQPATWLKEEDWKYVKEATEKTVAMAKEMIIGVRRMKTPIYVPRRCRKADGSLTGTAMECKVSDGESCTKRGICYDLDVPEQYCEACTHNIQQVYKRGNGSYSDLLLLISVEDISALANAIPCQYEPSTDRPVVGRIIIDYDVIKNRMPVSRFKNVLLHELFHIILYPMAGPRFRNSKNNYARYNDEAFVYEPQNWTSTNGVFDRKAIYLKLPSVVKYVRNHFNCPDLTGAELANISDGYSTNYYNYAHFDNKLFPDALMAPVYSVGNTLSKLEVAVAIDSGWYEVNKSVGRDLTLTKGKGCDFARMSCHEYMKTVDYKPEAIYPYCERSAKHKWMCSLDHGQLVSCSGGDRDEDVQARFSYFHHCPIVLPAAYVTGDNSPYCKEEDDTELRELGASGGHSDSMCMKALHVKSKKSEGCPEIDRGYFGVCVRRNCTNDGFKFSFGGQHFFCPKEGGEKHIEGTNTVNGCKVSYKFCCPDYDVCSEEIKNDTSLMKLGRCCGNRFGKSVVLLLTVYLYWFGFYLLY